MVAIRFASALAVAAAVLPMASAQDSSSSSKIVSIPTPTATVAASAMVEIGCFATGTPLEDHGVGDFASPGACQQICLGLNKDVLGLSDGTNCWCGMEFPPLDSKVDNGTCNTPCSGTDKVKCGGKKKLWVMTTGNTRNSIDYFEPDTSSSASVSKPAATSKAAETVIVSTTPTASAAPEKKPNKVGIAVGVVVGVLALCAIIGGIFVWLRVKKRRELEEEHRRQAAVNSFVAGGKLHTSNSSMTDSRLDPDFMSRRQSNGSIADNEDYSRRILKVTNA